MLHSCYANLRAHPCDHTWPLEGTPKVYNMRPQANLWVLFKNHQLNQIVYGWPTQQHNPIRIWELCSALVKFQWPNWYGYWCVHWKLWSHSQQTDCVSIAQSWKPLSFGCVANNLSPLQDPKESDAYAWNLRNEHWECSDVRASDSSTLVTHFWDMIAAMPITQASSRFEQLPPVPCQLWGNIPLPPFPAVVPSPPLLLFLSLPWLLDLLSSSYAIFLPLHSRRAIIIHCRSHAISLFSTNHPFNSWNEERLKGNSLSDSNPEIRASDEINESKVR